MGEEEGVVFGQELLQVIDSYQSGKQLYNCKSLSITKTHQAHRIIPICLQTYLLISQISKSFHYSEDLSDILDSKTTLHAFSLLFATFSVVLYILWTNILINCL